MSPRCRQVYNYLRQVNQPTSASDISRALPTLTKDQVDRIIRYYWSTGGEKIFTQKIGLKGNPTLYESE